MLLNAYIDASDTADANGADGTMTLLVVSLLLILEMRLILVMTSLC